MRGFLLTVALCAVSAVAAPGLQHVKRDTVISQDGTCGNGITCEGSIYGDCCSDTGFCGATSDYCSSGCNSAYGLCGTATASSYSNATTTSPPLVANTTNPTCPKFNGTIYIAPSLNEYEIDCGFDRVGNDLKSVQISSNKVADCIAQCEITSGCVDIIMSGTTCYMKYDIGKTSRSTGLRGARLFKLGPSSSTTSSTPTTSASASGSSSSTNSTGSATESSASSTTSSASLPTSTNPTCPSSNNTEFVATSGAIFLIECFMDRTGSDIKSVNIASNKIADCINACAGTAGCVDISMSGTACYLKSKIGSTYTSNKAIRGARQISAAPSSSSSSSTVSATPSASANSTSVGTGVSSSSSISSTSSSSSVVSGLPTSSVNATSSSSISSSSSSSASGSPSISVNSTSSIIGTGSSSSSVILSTGVSSSSSVILSTGASSYISSSSSSSSVPYGNSTGSSSTSSTGPTAPLSTGVSSSSSSSSSLAVGTGVSRDTSSSSTGSSPYGNGTSTSSTAGPTGTGSVSISLSTGVSSSTSVSVSSSTSTPYGNGTSSSTTVGPTGTGSVSVPLSTGFSSSTSVSVNSTTSVNTTTTSTPPTTAPITTGPSSGSSIPTSNSTGIFTNSTATSNTTSTTSYAFSAGGIPSGHPVVTNTTACSTAPTSTASCTPCEGQPGTDQYCGFTVSDDSYSNMPITCNTVEVSIELTECTVAPDGISRDALCINGATPGPLIEANWGDTIVVHVTNSMSINGTSIHWHGMRQNYTNEMDGVVSITQCALAPGQSQTYTFKATNYGFSWYHSHLALQAYMGLFGPMRIHGPVSQSADVEADNLIIQDWSHISVDAMYLDAELNGVRTMDSGLINGKNVWGADGSANQTGERYTVPTDFESNKTYLFNIVNSAIQSTYKFYIDNHTMTVISMDYVPIVPYETNILNINIGQRYQVIVRADQPVGDYWLRFDNQNACATTTQADNIKGIVHYSGSAGGTPNSTAYDYDRKYSDGVIVGNCTDEDSSNLVPVFAQTVGAETTEVDESIVVSNSNPLNLYRWYLGGTTFQADWSDATLYDIYNNGTVPDYSGNLAIDVPNLGEWVYVIVESAVPLGHSIHLHGHDFYVLASGYGSYDSSVTLNLDNPPRRDVAFMPGDGPTGQGGFLVVAHYTDNPGVWLMHCHIGWHVAMGFALQFIEAQDLIKDTVKDSCSLDNTCTTWRNWADEHDIVTDDSGV